MKPVRTGDVVGDYRVIGIAGTGGMGAVFQIEHVITKRIEALKLLPPGSWGDIEQVQRFEREIQVQARLHHPNIAQLYNAVRDGDLIGLVMEFVEGESLQRMLESGPLEVETAVDFSIQVLGALAYAHAAGVIHRDVAPSNIIVTPDRRAKLTDFGLARGAKDLRLSTSGVPLGSPWYMSPEQVRGLVALDGRTDLYSMGAVLHEMLTGGKLFEVEGAFAVMRAHVETEPEPPSARNTKVPRALDEVVRKAVAKDPARRFQSAEEFRLALEVASGRTASVPAMAAGMMTAAWPPVLPTLPPVLSAVLPVVLPAVPPALPAVPLALAGVPPRRPWYQTSRAVAVMALGPAVMVAGFYAMRLQPATARAQATARKTAESAPQIAAPVLPAAAVPIPSEVPPAVPPVVAPAQSAVRELAVTKPRPRAKPPSKEVRKAEPAYAIRVTGGEAHAPAAVAPVAKPEHLAEAPEPSAPVAGDAAPPELVATPTESLGALEWGTPQGAAPEKPNGNRFVKALGKVFGRRAKTPARKD